MQALLPLLGTAKRCLELQRELVYYAPRFAINGLNRLSLYVGGRIIAMGVLVECHWKCVHSSRSYGKSVDLLFVDKISVTSGTPNQLCYCGETTDCTETALEIVLTSLRVALQSFLSQCPPELATHNQQVLDEFLSAIVAD